MKDKKSKRITLHFGLSFCQPALLRKALLAGILIFAFFIVSKTEAAQLNLTSEIKEGLGLNQQFQVDLFLNAENEEINALEGKISFPENLLELKEVREGNSIINFWIEKPIPKDGGITFSGIIPGGYSEPKGFIFSIIFQSKNKGEGIIEIKDAKTLLNDGKGTPAETKTSNFQFSISSKILDSTFYFLDSKKDTDPPESFSLLLAQNQEIFDGKYFLVFATQDKISGIAHYQVRERKVFKVFGFNFGRGKWQKADSPYLLKDQQLKSEISVKAVDKAGNERVAVLSSKYPLKWYKIWWIWFIIILALAVIIFIIIRFRKIKCLKI